jgi:lipopolysaccharide/colanic/teichoic acid biosynthesis glycosyltransferase
MSKRIFDILASGFGLIILSPLFLGITLAIRLDSKGPIFYRARRVGQYGKEFRLYKFRSMVVDADRLGPGITTAEDKRITSFGRSLRRTKLDELPQLINVLLGDMSLVGPRPEDPRYVAFYNSDQQEILQYRPGITSLASLTYRNEEQLLCGSDWKQMYIQEVMPTKLAIDLDYSRRATLLTDIKLIIQTIVSQ